MNSKKNFLQRLTMQSISIIRSVLREFLWSRNKNCTPSIQIGISFTFKCNLVAEDLFLTQERLYLT